MNWFSKMAFLVLLVSCQACKGAQTSWEEARSAKREIVNPMRLEGRTISDALDPLLLRGFACGIIAKADRDPYISCSLVLSLVPKRQTPTSCRVLVIGLLPRWNGSNLGVEQAIEQLHSARIEQLSSGGCALDGSEERSFLGAPVEGAEVAQVATKISNAHLTGADALKRMLANGFECGLRRSPQDSKSALVCSRRPSETKGCLEEVIAIELIQTPRERNALPMRLLRRSKLTGASGSCRYLQSKVT